MSRSQGKKEVKQKKARVGGNDSGDGNKEKIVLRSSSASRNWRILRKVSAKAKTGRRGWSGSADFASALEFRDFEAFPVFLTIETSIRGGRSVGQAEEKEEEEGERGINSSSTTRSVDWAIFFFLSFLKDNDLKNLEIICRGWGQGRGREFPRPL